jgi:hypothetical protein
MRIAILSTLSVGSLLLGLGIPVIHAVDSADEFGQGKFWAHVGKGLWHSLLFTGAGIAGWRMVRRTRGLRVFVCPESIVQVHNNRALGLRWDEIVEVQRIVRTSEEIHGRLTGLRELKLTGSSGEMLSFNETLSDLRKLREVVEECTLDHLLAPHLEEFRRGETLVFGKLSISQHGLYYGREILPWEEYEDAKVAKGALTVWACGRKKPFCRVLLAEVPNCHVLLALAGKARVEDAVASPDDSQA